MSKISAKNTSIELIVRRWLHYNGFRYRLQNKKIPGNPDIAFPKQRIAIFVNGCFFHTHKNCNFVKVPKSNTDFWTTKLKGNVERDRKNLELLNNAGWNVFTLWECELEPRKKLSSKREFTLNKLKKEILKIISTDDTSN